MIRTAVLAGLLALGAAVPALAGGDPAAVAAVEAFLRNDEKAMLAAVLADKDAAADFNDDVKLAGADPKLMKLVLDKWRGRIVAYAEADARIPTPDVEGTYKNYGALMTPRTRAYMLRRLKTMSDNDRNSLIEYLDAVDTALKDNNGKLTWYTKKVVAGIFDKYREDLNTYLPTPFAQGAKLGGPAASASLASLHKAAEQPAVAVPATPSTKDPVVKKPPVPGKKPAVVADGKNSVAVSSSTAALDQARDAAEAERRAGGNFDGNVTAPADGSVAGGNGSGRPPLGASTPGAKPSLTAGVPSPSDPDDNFLSDVKKLKTGKAPMKFFEYVPAGLGLLLGGLIGFLLGGPIGLLIGAGAGIIAGDALGSKFFK